MTSNAINGRTKLAAFLGSPAAHSLSPLMHNYAFQHCHINARYLAFDITKEEFPAAIQAFRTFDLLGANVSMPNKIAAVALMDEVSPAVRLSGALNTIVVEEGRLIGHNTDGIGFCASLKEQGIEPTESAFVILGSGGSAKAIIAQLALLNCRKIQVFNRPCADAEERAAYFQAVSQETNCPISFHSLESEQKLQTALHEPQTILVNTTNVGMGHLQGADPLPPTIQLNQTQAVVDIIYQPAETALLKRAGQAGCQTLNGLGMLLHQGAASFRLWTGQELPVSEVREAILTTLNT